MGLILALCIFVSSHTFAQTAQEQCATKNFMQEMGPVRDQGDMGWCYANAAADMLGYELGRQRTSPLSSVMMALIYNFEWEDNALAERGYLSATLKQALDPIPASPSMFDKKSRGYCPAQDEEKVFKSGPQLSLKQKLILFKKMKQLYDQGKYDKTKLQELNALYAQLVSQGSILADFDLPKLYDLFSRSSEKTVFINFADYVCGQDREYNQIPNLKVQARPAEGECNLQIPGKGTKTFPLKLNLFNELNDELNKNNIVGISYFDDFLLNSAEVVPKTEMHASLVVGRRWKNNSCQYLIRNSWGPKCTRYSKYVVECIEGNLWVSEEDLKKNLEGITYLTTEQDHWYKQYNQQCFTSQNI